MATRAKKTTPVRAGRPPIAHAAEATLRATIGLLAERGLEGFSMDDVAQRAGLGRMTVYRRWNSREALVVDAIAHAIKEHNAPGIPDTGDLREDLLQLTRDFTNLMNDTEIGRILVKLVAASINESEWAQSFTKRVNEQRVRTRIILERAVERGELPRGTDVDLALDLISGTSWFRILVRGQRLDAKVRMREADVILAGLGYKPRPAKRSRS